MKRTITALAVGALAAFGAGNALAYATFLGEDRNGASTVIRPFPNSTQAQLDFFGTNTPQVENFENLTLGPGPLTLGFGSSNTAVSATLTGAGGAVEQVIGNPTDGRYSVPGGTKFWAAAAKNTGDTFAISFTQKVEAFGFFGIDIGDFGGSLTVDLLDENGNAMANSARTVGNLASGHDGSVLYFGIRAANESEWFRGVRFSLTNKLLTGQDIFAFDSFSVVRGVSTAPPPGGTTPEPGSLALAALALLGLGLTRRRA